MVKDLLLEIGTEEIPAKFFPGALEQLKELAAKALTAERLQYEEIKYYGTPRRLVLYVAGLQARQSDLVEEVKGPAAKAAFDAQGEPTKAALGFARSNGVDPSQLELRQTPAGVYVFATRKVAGQDTVEVLNRLLPSLIRGISFPKPMRWGYKELRFARPIRWLVALFGEQVVPFELEGLTAGNISYGHRFLSQGKVTLTEARSYLQAMREAFVIADPAERKELIWQQVTQLAEQVRGQVEEDPELLNEVTYLLEYPTALLGKVDAKYMELPPEVIITPMREHQRYFPVWGDEGKLLPYFITVRNGGTHGLEVVREGNEKVLRARLADAQFFYTEDQKVSLDDNVEKLKKIVFQEALGTLYEKVERIEKLTAYLLSQWNIGGEEGEAAKRAARLAKADLVSNMVYEFPELQGIMGAYYARLAGEGEGTVQGIREHYMPRFAGDQVPSSVMGTVVSIADKIDTIVGCFAVGIQPTGSQDPYALRRQALGICHILLAAGRSLSISQLIKESYGLYQGKIAPKLTLEELEREVVEFFAQRLRNIFLDRGTAYDEVDAVLSSSADNPVEAWKRAEALGLFRREPGFDALITAYTRAANLAKKGTGASVQPELLLEASEKDLWEAVQRAETLVQSKSGDSDYLGALGVVASLREPIDAFFNGVMVMADDEKIRENRLALLKKVVDLISPLADLGKIIA